MRFLQNTLANRGRKQHSYYWQNSYHTFLQTECNLAYPTLGSPTIPHFKLVPIRPIRIGRSSFSSFFFGGILIVKNENYAYQTQVQLILAGTSVCFIDIQCAAHLYTDLTHLTYYSIPELYQINYMTVLSLGGRTKSCSCFLLHTRHYHKEFLSLFLQ